MDKISMKIKRQQYNVDKGKIMTRERGREKSK